MAVPPLMPAQLSDPGYEDPTMIGAAVAFCFLGACYVGIEPKKKGNERAEVVGETPNGLPKLS